MTHTSTSPTIRIEKAGGPEEMKLVDLPVGAPGAGEVRIRHHASGLNYIDVYQRSGVYAMPMPLAMGNEGAGVIEAVGAGVTHLKEGDRAAYCSGPPGSYSVARVMPAKTVVKLPEAISFETGAAMMLKGLTTQYLLKRVRAQEALEPGDFILWHAAASHIRQTQVVLGACVSGIGGFAPPTRRLAIVAGHALPARVHVAQTSGSGRVPCVSRFAIALEDPPRGA